MDRRPCMCLPFGTTKAGRARRVVTRGPGGTEAGQVGTPEAGLSGFEADRCVLPRRTAVNDSSVTCSEALSDGHAISL